MWLIFELLYGFREVNFFEFLVKFILLDLNWFLLFNGKILVIFLNFVKVECLVGFGKIFGNVVEIFKFLIFELE